MTDDLAAPSLVHNFIAMSYSPKTPNLDQNRFFGPVSPLTDGFEKQQDTCSMRFQALCIMLWPFVNHIWSYSPETSNFGRKQRFF